MPNELVKQISYILYKADEEDVKVNALLKDESIWLTQNSMAELLKRSLFSFTQGCLLSRILAFESAHLLLFLLAPSFLPLDMRSHHTAPSEPGTSRSFPQPDFLPPEWCLLTGTFISASRKGTSSLLFWDLNSLYCLRGTGDHTSCFI